MTTALSAGTVPSRIKAVFEGITEFITALFRLAFNGIAKLWNSTVGSLDVNLPSFLGGGHIGLPKIPTMATGGTVLPTPGGTVVRVAEARRAESIVDTGKLNRLLDKATNAPAAPPITIYVTESVSPAQFV